VLWRTRCVLRFSCTQPECTHARPQPPRCSSQHLQWQPSPFERQRIVSYVQAAAEQQVCQMRHPCLSSSLRTMRAPCQQLRAILRARVHMAASPPRSTAVLYVQLPPTPHSLRALQVQWLVYEANAHQVQQLRRQCDAASSSVAQLQQHKSDMVARFADVAACSSGEVGTKLQLLQQHARVVADSDCMRGVEISEPPQNYASKLLLAAISDMNDAMSASLPPNGRSKA